MKIFKCHYSHGQDYGFFEQYGLVISESEDAAAEAFQGICQYYIYQDKGRFTLEEIDVTVAQAVEMGSREG